MVLKNSFCFLKRKLVVLFFKTVVDIFWQFYKPKTDIFVTISSPGSRTHHFKLNVHSQHRATPHLFAAVFGSGFNECQLSNLISHYISHRWQMLVEPYPCSGTHKKQNPTVSLIFTCAKLCFVEFCLFARPWVSYALGKVRRRRLQNRLTAHMMQKREV